MDSSFLFDEDDNGNEHDDLDHHHGFMSNKPKNKE